MGNFAPRMDILVIAPRFPWPLEKGDKLRLYQIIRHLSIEGRVHLFALTHQHIPAEDLEQVSRYCASWKIFRIPRGRLFWNLLAGMIRGLPVSVAWFTDSKALRELQAYREACQPQVTFGQLARIGEYLCPLPGPKVIDLMDAFSVIAGQRAAASPWPLSLVYRFEARRLAAYELRMRACTEHQVFISQRDREAMDPSHAWSATIVPNGIDMEHFQPRPDVRPKHDIVFVGNLGYFPNIEAARFLVKSVMPLIWSRRPNTRVLLAGARPAPGVRSLASDKVTVQAWLPDIRDAYADGGIFAAPVFSGAGLQNKILEAMAMELPVVTTSHVNRAISAQAGTQVLLADSAVAFADALLHLMEEEQRRGQMGHAGYIFVRQHFSWQESIRKLVQQALYPAIHARDPERTRHTAGRN